MLQRGEKEMKTKFKNAKFVASLVGLVAIGGVANADGSHSDKAETLLSWAQDASAELSDSMTYPHMAIRRNSEGVASYRVTIDRDGEVLDAEVIDLPHSVFLRTAAKKVVKRLDLPSLPDQYAANTLTFQLNLNYQIGDASDARQLRTGRVRGEEIAEAAAPSYAGIIIESNSAND